MKRFFMAVLATIALSSCGGSSTTPAEVDTAGTVVIDTIVSADTTTAVPDSVAN